MTNEETNTWTDPNLSTPEHPDAAIVIAARAVDAAYSRNDENALADAISAMRAAFERPFEGGSAYDLAHALMTALERGRLNHPGGRGIMPADLIPATNRSLMAALTRWFANEV